MGKMGEEKIREWGMVRIGKEGEEGRIGMGELEKWKRDDFKIGDLMRDRYAKFNKRRKLKKKKMGIRGIRIIIP